MSIHAIEPGFLLAAPRLGDPNFEGAVVLLGVHDDEGSLGWTLNGPLVDDAATIVRATSLVSAGDTLPAAFSHPALRGGPVSPASVWILYQREHQAPLLPGSIAIGEQISVTGSVEALRRLIAGSGPKTFRLIVGYAGWGPGQLAGELSRGAWLPGAADASILFGKDTTTLWQRAYRKTIGNVPQAFVPTRGIA